MRIEGRRCRDEWIPNYYPSRRIMDGHLVRISRAGKTLTLSEEENDELDEVFMKEELFNRLEATGHIVTAKNAKRVFEEIRKWNEPVYAGPSLHIVVLTSRCNLNCIYCHMNPQSISASKETYDLKPEVAREIIRFAFESPNPTLAFEFQGGEPFLNFPGMKYFVEEARPAKSLSRKGAFFQRCHQSNGGKR